MAMSLQTCEKVENHKSGLTFQATNFQKLPKLDNFCILINFCPLSNCKRSSLLASLAFIETFLVIFEHHKLVGISIFRVVRKNLQHQWEAFDAS